MYIFEKICIRIIWNDTYMYVRFEFIHTYIRTYLYLTFKIVSHTHTHALVCFYLYLFMLLLPDSDCIRCDWYYSTYRQSLVIFFSSNMYISIYKLQDSSIKYQSSIQIRYKLYQSKFIKRRDHSQWLFFNQYLL